ncbi:MAG: hypothetical protein ACUVX8_10570 [Candidatus Zipacnadales bacterium]
MLVPFEAYILIAVIALVAVGPIVFGPVRKSVLSPVVWIAVVYVVAFVVRPLYILLFPDKAHPYIYNSGQLSELIVNGLGLVLVGMVVFWGGYLGQSGRQLASLLPELPQEMSASRWRVAILGLLVLGLGGYGLLLRQAGGVGALAAMLYMRAAFYESDEFAGGLKLVTRLAGLAAIMGVHHHLTMRRSWWTWPLVLLASFVMGTTGGRGAVIMGLWLVIYFLYAIYREKYRSWRVLAILLGCLAIVATAALTARRATARGLSAVVPALLQFPRQFTEAALEELRGFDYMVSAMRATGHEIELQEGATYEPLLTLLVPRAFRSAQPVSAGMMLRAAIEPQGLGGRPGTAMGEGYMNFGMIGALAEMFLLGLWCRALHSYGVRTLTRSLVAPLLYANALASVPHLLLGVAPLAIRGLLLDTVALVLAFLWAARTREVTAFRPVGGMTGVASEG